MKASGAFDKISLVRNTFYSTLIFFSNLFLLGLLILGGRYLGDANYGIFTFALAFAFIFEIFTDLGVSDFSQREVARDKKLAVPYFGNLLLWKSLLSMGVFIALVLTINLLKSSPETRLAVYLLGFAGILRSFKVTCRSFFRAFERFDLDCLTAYIERCTLLATGIVVLILGGGLISFALVFVVVRVFDLVLTFGILNWKVVKIIPKFNFAFLRQLQIKALPFGLFSVIVVLYSYADTVMLSFMRTDVEVGWYNGAYKIYEGLIVFPWIICAVLYPRLSQLFVSTKNTHFLLSSRAVKYMFIISFPILICGIMLSKNIVNILFGQEFQNSVVVLQILLAGIVFLFQIQLFQTILNSIDKQKVVMYVGVTGLIVNILLNLLLIPRYGVKGAAVTTVASELMVFSIYCFYLYRSSFKISIWKSSLKPLFASLIVGGLIWKFNSLPLILLLFLGLALYLFSLFCFRVFDSEERNLVCGLARAVKGRR